MDADGRRLERMKKKINKNSHQFTVADRNEQKQKIFGISSISRGKSEGRPEGAKRPTAGDEPREFTSRGEGGRVPPFFEKLQCTLPFRRESY